jgi:small subunit ribosomal protein S4
LARYTGPDCKLCRREGIKLYLKGTRCLTKKCAIERRNTPPGMHGASSRRRKQNDYALQLREKQKARRIYGVLEMPFHRLFEEAERQPGRTGENLLRLLETRLDNVVYRLGLGSSRDEARQVVCHGHVTVNSKKVDIPSYQVRVGDRVEISEGSRQKEGFKTLSDLAQQHTIPQWLSPQGLGGQVLSIPLRAECEQIINEQLIVEYYSR